MFFYGSQSCLGLQWFWSSCPFRCWGSRLPLPIAVFRISSRGLCSFLFTDFVPGWLVLRLLRWCSAVSSCFPAFSRLADPCYFYSLALSLCSILGGSALHVFLLLAFGPLGWLFILSPSPWSTRCFCWSVPTLPSCSVGPPGSLRLALPRVRGFSYQGVLVLFLRSVSIWPPSFPAPQVSYGLVVVSPGWSPPLWLFSFPRPMFVHCGLVLCCLSPVCLPHLGRGYVVSSVFISYAVCLCRLCSWCLRDGVTLAWVECRCCFLPSIGTKATFLSVLSIPSGWGHPLGQVCFLFPLISIEGSLSFWFLFLPLGSRVRCLCLPLVPWVGFIVGLCAPLLCVASL